MSLTNTQNEIHMRNTKRSNNYLSVADPVLWSGIYDVSPYIPATVIGIELYKTPHTVAREKVLVVSWSEVGNCILHLDNGKTTPGCNIMPVNIFEKHYSFPEPLRLN